MVVTINPSDQTITQYNIQTGGVTNLLNNVAPSATSGVAVISQGASSQPVFGTVVVAGGGTGAVTLTGLLTGNGTSAVSATAITQYNIITGGATNLPNSVAPSATSGVPVISQGSSSQPIFGTAAIAGGGTNATSFGTSTGIVKYDGSSLVTSTAATLSATNVLSNTAQPCFLATLSSSASNVTGDSTLYTVLCNNVVFDQASNYNGTTGIFTAPVAGRYLFTGQVTLTGLGAGHTLGIVRFAATATDYFGLRGNYGAMRDNGNALTACASCIINMAASDTCRMKVDVDNSTKTVSVFGQTFSSGATTAFSGHLIC